MESSCFFRIIMLYLSLVLLVVEKKRIKFVFTSNWQDCHRKTDRRNEGFSRFKNSEY